MAESEQIKLLLPSKYSTDHKLADSTSSQPSLEWLTGTWTVTHSTLSMWRSNRNVRISYKILPAKDGTRPRIDDLVEYEPSKKTGVLKSVEGVDTQAHDGGWNWRGKGWLAFVTSHWELLGWGEAKLEDGTTERWAVTWFASTLFTKEGVDVYCSRPEGISSATYGGIEAALKEMNAKGIVDMVNNDMQPVEIKLPWATK